ncbi:hypothetical protein [Streptomyces wuyuanensis]|uniref:hypothetical protein n=1 Tax=Streptomyces wuyuanensis TaxID=1196353 RepID=UPI00379BC968
MEKDMMAKDRTRDDVAEFALVPLPARPEGRRLACQQSCVDCVRLVRSFGTREITKHD